MQTSTSPEISRSWPVSGAKALKLGLALISTSAAASTSALSVVFSEWPRYFSAMRMTSASFSSAIRPLNWSEASKSPHLVGRALRLAIADALRAPEIGHAVLQALVVVGIGEARRHVDDVGQLGVVERLQHVGDDHPLDEIVRREDDVVAGIALAQLGEHLVVAGEQVVAHRDAGGLGELVQRVLADIGIPVVDVDLLFLCTRQARQRRGGGGDGEAAGEKGAAGEDGSGRRRRAAGHRAELRIVLERGSIVASTFATRDKPCQRDHLALCPM